MYESQEKLAQIPSYCINFAVAGFALEKNVIVREKTSVGKAKIYCHWLTTILCVK